MNKPLKTVPDDPPPDTKTTRFEMRMTPYIRKVVKRAAEIQGRSMSDFIVAAAEEAAQKAIRNAHIIELTIDEQRAFAHALLDPPKLGSAWKRARESHRRLISESR
jgi:uncharacterized protein (DUF1778 family)